MVGTLRSSLPYQTALYSSISKNFAHETLAMDFASLFGNTEVQVDLGTKHAGYIPYDEVSTDPSVKPEDILKVGDEIEVFVVRVNDQEGTVQLSKKKLPLLPDRRCQCCPG